MSFHEQVHRIGQDPKRHSPAVPVAVRADQLLATGRGWASHNWAVVRRAPHDAVPKVVHLTSGNLHFPDHVGDDTRRLCQTTRFPAA